MAAGGSRRQVLKGLLGLGGAAIVSGSVLEGDASAAVRRTPTPTPVKCPGKQVPVNGACACPGGLSKCGPDCCNPSGVGAAHSECCDNACCYGTCYGEELCCPNARVFCPVSGECCPEGWTCCSDYGCISPDLCCIDPDCPADACFIGECAANHRCEYSFDCRAGLGCCTADACYQTNCQEDGSCSEPVFDCNLGEGCCDESQTCLANGECCSPSCPAGYCGEDGCGGTCGPCAEGQVCSGGGCFTPCTGNAENQCPQCSIWQCLPSSAGQLCLAPNYTACPTSGECPEGFYCTGGLCAQACS